VGPFERLSTAVDLLTAKPVAFASACLVVLLWLTSGPLFGFSDTWQLVINTGTTIVTFLMVFLLQNSQSRQAQSDRELLDRIAELIQREEQEIASLEDSLGD
jgi:low affinity Fe/Cu permease